jgi:hypothetical protein
MITAGRILLLGALVAGCVEPESGDMAASDEAPELDVEELAGLWRVEGMVSSDCPEPLVRPMPLGDTVWTAEGGRLSIAAMFDGQPVMDLLPTGPDRLGQQTEISVPGCTGTETLELVLEQRNAFGASGTFTAHMAHDGRETCRQMARDAGLPDACWTTVRWQARRR